jgi:hypothetical protein
MFQERLHVPANFVVIVDYENDLVLLIEFHGLRPPSPAGPAGLLACLRGGTNELKHYSRLMLRRLFKIAHTLGSD